jgi:cell division protein FtsQ
MDGAGRLARSAGSQGPPAELKPAAIDAVGWVRRARPMLDREPADRWVALVERYLPARAGVAATVLILLGSAGLGIVKGGHVEELTSALNNTRNAVANSAGFRINSVVINGRKQLSQDEVLAIGGVSGHSSLLFLDAASVRDRLKADPWIAEATVLKLYPGQLQIDIVERSAFALWQQDGRISVIADDGAVLEPYLSRRFVSLPLVVGERRWNLRLKDGLDIRLPENDVGNALAELSRLDKEDKLFSRDIVAIDMRLPDRLTVQLSDDAAKAREELSKDKKPKKKAGEA